MATHQLWYPSRHTRLKVAKQRNGCPRQIIEKQRPSWTSPQPPFRVAYSTYSSEISQDVMESIDDQRCVDGRAQGQSVGVDAAVRCNPALLSSLEAHHIGQKQKPPCNMADRVNGCPAITAVDGSSEHKIKFERVDDRVSLNYCIALATSILRMSCPFRQVNSGPTLGPMLWHWSASQRILA